MGGDMNRIQAFLKYLLIFMLAILLTPSSRGFSANDDGQAESSESVRTDKQVSTAILNNSRLRSYYFREYRERHFQEGDHPMVSRSFIENWIDLQIIYNTKIISEKLDALKESYEYGNLLLQRLEKEPGRTDIRRETRLFFKDFREKTKSLRGKIDFMVSGLDSKPDDGFRNYSVEKESAGNRMNMVKEELNEAERLIRNYFLEPTHTVDVSDLEENNMMIRLYRIEKILESLEKTEL